MSQERDPLGGLSEPRSNGSVPSPSQSPAGARPRQRLRSPSTPTAWILVLVLGGFFIAQTVMGNWNPEDPLVLFRMGALNWGAIFNGEHASHAFFSGDWWRLGSYSFLHVGFTHFLLNAWALWILMRLIEGSYGSVSALGIYCISVLVGGVASVAWALHGPNPSPFVTAAGASGGIAGLFGAFIALWIRVRKRVPPEAARSTLRMLLLNLGLNVLLAWQAGAQGILLDNAAHLGGLSIGLIFGLLAPLGNLPRFAWSRPAQAILVLATFMLAAMEGAAVSRALHPHPRLLRGDGISAEVPSELVPLCQVEHWWEGCSGGADGEALSDDDSQIFSVPSGAPVGIAVSPGGIGLSAIISRSPLPLSLPANSEAMPIGDRTWLRVRSSGPSEGQELQALSAKEGSGSVLIRVLCSEPSCKGQLADDAAIEMARTFKVN